MGHREQLYRRVRGILIGGAVGDAMGMPTEFWTREKIRERLPGGVTGFLPSTEWDFIGRKMKAGEVTDDTIQTTFVLNAIVAQQGHINAERYVETLIDWVDHSEIARLVCGPSTLKAIDRIKNGVSLAEAGRFGSTNGAAMKIAPVGIVSDYRSISTLADRVYQLCLPTHNTQVAVSGAAAIAACVSAVSAGERDISALWNLANATVIASQGRGENLPSPSLLFRLRYARDLVLNSAKEAAVERLHHELGTGVETVETLPAVLAIVHLAGGQPMEAARISANLGGDTDTIGSLSTAICGGMNPDFDAETVTMLETVNHLDFGQMARDILPYSPFY